MLTHMGTSPGTPAPEGDAAGPLSGFTVAVTAERRAEEIGGAFERRGATVMHAPALRIVPLADNTELRQATAALTEDPPDTVVVTTGIGFRSWLEAAEGWGQAERLRAAFAGATLLARGPKATGAIRAAGLREAWSPESESSAEMLRHLLAEGPLPGRRIAVQLHGEPLQDFTDALGEAGAAVVRAPVYQWTAPDDLGPLDRLLDAIASGSVDAVTFTSALAATGLLRRAGELELTDAVLRAFGAEETGTARVVAACVGPTTAGPLLDAGIAATWPERFRVGPLVRHVADVLNASAAEAAEQTAPD